MVIIAILLSTTFISLISLVGIFFLGTKTEKIQKIIFWLVCFATGTLLGGAFFHLLPESWELNRNTPLYFIVGILIFFILEKFFFWRHCHKEECDLHAFTYLNLVGDGIHNFIDGVVIAASFITDIQLGITTSLAVAFHEIPQELGDFGILIYGGFTMRKALLFNFISALTCVLGGILTYFLSSYAQVFKTSLLGIAGGGFIYIALVDLLPELRVSKKLKTSIIQFLLILFGLVFMWGIRFILH
jgi:zinc and cadmium transporter